MRLPAICAALLAVGISTSASAQSYEIEFGSSPAGPGSITGKASDTIAVGGATLTISAGTPLSLLNNQDNDGLGINSSGVPGVTDPDTDEFNALSAGFEIVNFSFNVAGALTGLDLNGVSAGDLEYFQLALDNVILATYFDETANLSLVSFPLEANLGPGDLLSNLNVPFTAGQVISLTYGEAGAGNGARIESITVSLVPEPGTMVLASIAALALGVVIRRR